jgi:hypothetical protein
LMDMMSINIGLRSLGILILILRLFWLSDSD